MKKIAIIGAGISGLSTAYAIERLAGEVGLDVEVTVFEREDRTGGKKLGQTLSVPPAVDECCEHHGRRAQDCTVADPR